MNQNSGISISKPSGNTDIYTETETDSVICNVTTIDISKYFSNRYRYWYLDLLPWSIIGTDPYPGIPR